LSTSARRVVKSAPRTLLRATNTSLASPGKTLSSSCRHISRKRRFIRLRSFAYRATFLLIVKPISADRTGSDGLPIRSNQQ
jgi:hypothetical protein